MYSSQNNNRMITSRDMGLTGMWSSPEEKSNAYIILVGNPGGKWNGQSM
jgi:hypothetical protein